TDFTGDIEDDLLELESSGIVECYRAERFAIIKFKGVSPIVFFPKEVKDAYYKNLMDIREFKRDLFNSSEIATVKQDTDLMTIQNKTMPKLTQSYLFN